ncbi:MAG: hypothetical protein VB084_01385 [Syntrophomonadaceae bacterium]|nr:hypothetical protein [Syntrophomonadaceae bacterium]
MGYITRGNIVSGLIVAFFTFFIALTVSIGTEVLVKAVQNVWIAIVLLIIIIALGIFFDIIGTAAAAVSLPPFNARAAKKIFGASQAVKIAKNASSVANYCNDVIGDIAGTLSGAVGAGIVISLEKMFNLPELALMGAVMTSFIAAFTVGGKSLGKNIAIAKANNIIFRVAVVLGWWENLTGLELFKDRR